MNIELKPHVPEQKVEEKKDIYLNGILIGEVKPAMNSDKYHAMIHLERYVNKLSYRSASFLQGLGVTIEEAVENAFKQGLQDTKEVLDAIEMVSAEIFTSKKDQAA